MNKRSWSKDDKKLIALEAEKEGISATARKYQLSKSQVWIWHRDYVTFADKEDENLTDAANLLFFEKELIDPELNRSLKRDLRTGKLTASRGTLLLTQLANAHRKVKDIKDEIRKFEESVKYREKRAAEELEDKARREQEAEFEDARRQDYYEQMQEQREERICRKLERTALLEGIREKMMTMNLRIPAELTEALNTH